MHHRPLPGRVPGFRRGGIPGGFLEDPAPQGGGSLLPRERQRPRRYRHMEPEHGRDQGRQDRSQERGGAEGGRDPGR